jgi:hypothetical protein
LKWKTWLLALCLTMDSNSLLSFCPSL